MNFVFKKLVVALLIVNFFSCSEDLNFKQAEKLVISPIYNSSLVNFSFLPSKFFDNSGALIRNSVTDSSDFTLFNNSFVKDNIFQFDLNVECKNEFERRIFIDLEFLDRNNNPTHPTIQFTVFAEDLNFTFQEIILIASNSSILNTVQVRITTTIETSGAPITAAEISVFELKSAIKGYFKSTI